MSEVLDSDNLKRDEFNLDTDEGDYNNLISRLKEIKKTIALLEKQIFR